MEYIFETAHLRVRKFEADDARKLYEHHLEPEVRQWIPNECYLFIFNSFNTERLKTCKL